MRLIKFLINLVAASLAATLTVLLVLYFMPSLQKSMLEAALERDARRSYSVGDVRFRLDGVDGRDWFVLDGGNGLEIKTVKLRISWFPVLLDREIRVSNGTLDGCLLDLSTTASALDERVSEYLAVADEPEKRRWIATQLERALSVLTRNGWEYEIRNLRMSGDILLPEEALRFAFTLQELDSDEPGKYEINLEYLEAR